MAGRKLPKVLTDDELAALLRQPNVRSPSGLRNKVMLQVMAYGGLRVSEVVNLRTRDIRREEGRIYLEIRNRKANDDTTVPLPDYVADSLDMWMDARIELGVGRGPVFCTISQGRRVHPKRGDDHFNGDGLTETELTPGDPLSRSYIGQMVKRYAESAGIEKRVSPHVLRHTAATRMLRRTGDIRRVQAFLGHADVRTTQIYTEVLASDVAEAVDAVPDVEADSSAADGDRQSRIQEQIAALKARLHELEAEAR